MGPKTLKAYIMAYFNLGKNYNDSGIVSWIVMACFRNKKNYNGTEPINQKKRKVRKRLSPFFSFAFSSETEDDSVKPAGSKHICIISQIPTCWNLIENMLYESVTNLKVIMVLVVSLQFNLTLKIFSLKLYKIRLLNYLDQIWRPLNYPDHLTMHCFKYSAHVGIIQTTVPYWISIIQRHTDKWLLTTYSKTLASHGSHRRVGTCSRSHVTPEWPVRKHGDIKVYKTRQESPTVNQGDCS